MNASQQNAGKGDILIIDDDTASLETLSSMLTQKGYAVRGLQGGQEGLKAFENKPPELILLAAQLPGMGGFEVCRRIKASANLSKIPVLILITSGDAEDKIRAFEAGALDYINKPFQKMEVMARVETHLKLSRLSQHLETHSKGQSHALEESEARFRAFMDNVPASAYIKDESNVHVYANKLALESAGKVYHDVIGKTTRDIWPLDIANKLVELDQKIINGEAPLVIEEWYDSTQGEKRWSRDIKFPIKLESGKRLLGGIAVDITDIKKSEHQLKELSDDLRESEERYRLIVESSPASIMAVRDGRFLFGNPASADMFGFLDADEMIGANVMDMVAPESHELATNRIQRLESGQNNPVAEMELIKKDGNRITVESASVSIPMNGVPTAVIISRDISERKKREEKLQMMQFSIDNALDRIAWIAPDGRFLYANKSACKEMNYTLEEVLSMRVSDINPFFSSEVWAEHFNHVKKMGSMRLETQQKSGDGLIHDIEVSTNHLKLGDNEFMCSFGRDITQLKDKEKRLKKALEEITKLKSRLEQENIYLREEIDIQHHQGEIIGKSQPVLEMLNRAEQVAETDSTVLILGETGTGKELLARAIHRLSQRKDRSMVMVNCAALPATLIESELFGREKGAYTGAMSRQTGRFEIADGSTLFLDEIGELPLELQAKLLRVLQEGQFERLGSSKTINVDVRIIASTNRDLAKAIMEGRFREDLYYRLNVFSITVPPLRDRIEDIPMLTWTFIKELSKSMGKTIEKIPQKDIDRLQGYQWPGNIRELRNMIESAMIVNKSKVLKLRPPSDSAATQNKGFQLEVVERDHIKAVLKKVSWRVSGRNGAAELLGLKPTTLEYRMKKLGIERPK